MAPVSRWSLVVVSLLVCGGALADPPPASAPATIPYVDAAFGFELKLPAGWEYDRTRFQPFEGSVGLLRGRTPGGQQALQILIFHIEPRRVEGAKPGEAQVRLPSFEDWVVEFGRSVAASANAERLEWETWNIPPRAGALLSYHTKLASTDTQNFALCVPFDPGTVWVLAYSAALPKVEDASAAKRAFKELAGTLRVTYDPMEVERLASAFDRGKALVDRLKDVAASFKPDERERFYTLALGDKKIGYLQRQISVESHAITAPDAKQRVEQRGLRVRERSWRFADDGTVRFSRLDLFSAFDRSGELIESELTQVPAPDVRPQQLLVKTDQIIRRDEVLVMSFRTNLDVGLPEPAKPMSVGPVYLDLAWTRVLPWLMRNAPAETHAFAVYGLDSRALLSQTVTPLGLKRVEGHPMELQAYEVREGLIDKPSVMYVDQEGMLVRLVAGDLIVDQVAREEVEKQFGRQRDEARKRFNLPDL